MGWGIRKSVKIGSMRVNISKSGLGVSAGTRGARVGINSKGRAYVAGGRKGLYYRQNIGSTRASGGTDEDYYEEPYGEEKSIWDGLTKGQTVIFGGMSAAALLLIATGIYLKDFIRCGIAAVPAVIGLIYYGIIKASIRRKEKVAPEKSE